LENTKAANFTAAGAADYLRDEQTNATFGEDCLTLNIWVPSGGDDKKAVMLWVYGGSFMSGGSSIATYNGQYIADQEKVIVVTIK
jgi:carboxylesterase type B